MSIKISGLDDLQDFLEKEVPKQATNILRSTVQGIASTIAKDAKKNAKSAGMKARGELVKGYKAKRRKMRQGKPRSDVIGAPHWHLVEYGTVQRQHKSGKSTGSMPETPIVNPAIDKANSDIEGILGEQVKAKIAAATKRAKKRRLKK